jgi:hypothetical protein
MTSGTDGERLPHRLTFRLKFSKRSKKHMSEIATCGCNATDFYDAMSFRGFEIQAFRVKFRTPAQISPM